VLCDKKIRVPIDDNYRLSTKDYRAFIYEEIKKRSRGDEQGQMLQFIPHESIMYRIREKQKKNIKTEQSDYVIKETIKYEPIKKLSINYEN
jgi:hypothetical protein